MKKIFNQKIFNFFKTPLSRKSTYRSFFCFKFTLRFQQSDIVPVSLIPVENLLPVSTTQTVQVAKFAAGVVETGGKFSTGVVDTGGAP
jgi:hypothetical protein